MSMNLLPRLRRRNLSPSVIHCGFCSPNIRSSRGCASSTAASGWRETSAATGSGYFLRAVEIESLSAMYSASVDDLRTTCVSRNGEQRTTRKAISQRRSHLASVKPNMARTWASLRTRAVTIFKNPLRAVECGAIYIAA